MEFKNPIDIYVCVLPFTTIFLAFNRILYPHYIPIIFPFFSVALFYLIDLYKKKITERVVKWQILSIFLGLATVYIGYILWSILWAIEGFQTYTTNIFFPSTAALCIGGLLIITIVSLWTISTNTNLNKRNEANAY